GGTLVIGMRSDFSGFNSITNSSQYTDEIIKYALFTPLVQYDDDLEVRPWLAESWEMEGDTGVVFTLRSDVNWHDGQPVTTRDVKFTFDMAKDSAAASLLGQAYLSQVKSAEVLDERRIRFLFDRPHAQALEDFWWAPMPEHLLGDVSAAEMRNAPYNRSPVGSGPFRFGEWRANDRLVLERNPDFPQGLGGPPPSGRVVFRIVPEPATLLTELVTGGLHVDIDVEPSQADEVQQNTQTTLESYAGRTVYFVAWNNNREPFTEASVRRALTHAINRQEIIDALLFGHGSVATSPIPPWSPLEPGVDPLPYDPERAMELLEQAGWRDADGDGVREKGGQRLAFTMLSSDAALNRSVVEVLQGQLRRVGVAVEPRVLEFQTMLAQFKARDYDATFANWVLDNFQVGTAPDALVHSRWAEAEGSANRTGFASPEADALLERGRAATAEEDARQVWVSFTELLQREQPVTFMFWLDELAGVRQEVQGVSMDPRGELSGIARWSLER
ncbi:MAG TPA: ABC transporter substrate-binding protein, partial [Longimicrobiales bacterium]|nr:ABC transporter substrate-binding protein [Longimicrobiales bacterium]